MKIYIVTDGCYSAYHIEAVFTDRKKAEMYASLNECDSVEVFETHDDNLQGEVKTGFRHEFNVYGFGGDMRVSYHGGSYTTKYETMIRGMPNRLYASVTLETRNVKKAEKIAQDLVAEWKAAWNEGRRDEHPRLVEYIKEIKEEGEEK